MLKNTPDNFGSVSKFFHWGMAAVIFGLLGIGLTLDELPDGLLKLQAYALHKSFGISVLALVLVRILWRFLSPPPSLLTKKLIEKRLAKTGHILLYILMVVMPLSGWLLSSAAGRPVSFFGLFTLPDFILPDKELREDLGELHETFADLLMFLLVAHVVAALKHHLIDKDSTLLRMLPSFRKKISFVIALCFLSSPVMAQEATAQAWMVDFNQSRFTFTDQNVHATDAPVPGTNASIAFDPNDLGHSSLSLSFSTALFFIPPGAESYISKIDPEILAKMQGDGETGDGMQATFQSASIEKVTYNKFIAHGTLTVNGLSHSVDVPFTVTLNKGDQRQISAMFDGSLTMNPSNFAGGTARNTTSRNIEVTFSLLAIPLV